MSRPTSKDQLLLEIEKERNALEEFLPTLTPGEMTQPGTLDPWSAKDVLRQVHSCYRQILKTIEGMTEADLFTRGRFVWTEKNALLAYIIPNTSSHYRWARTEMRKGMKDKQER